MQARAYRVAGVVILILFLLASTPAQDNPTIQVTAVSIPGSWNEDQSIIIKALTTAFEEKHAVISYNLPEWTVVIDVLPIDSVRYVIAWVLLKGLPVETVEFAKKNEVFYLSASQEQKSNFSPDGKIAREYMSEEFIRQYGLPIDSQILILQRKDLSSFAAKFVHDFYVKVIY